MEVLLHSFKLAANECATKTGFLPGLYKNVCTGPNGTPQLNSLQDILIIIANIVQILMALAGALAVIFIIVGAIFYVVSMGDPGRIKRAKDILTNSIVGLLVILMSYAVVTFIAGKF